MKKVSKKILILILIIMLVIPYTIYADDVKTVENEAKMTVAYNSHIQDLGWEKDFSKINGQESGTTGRNLKNEAIKIKLLNAPEGVGITYQAYINKEGWQDWKVDGQEAGTTGRNKIMEAFKIKLTGTEEYSVEYRTHLENYGWMDWKKDGEVSGAEGKGLKIEAVQIRIVSKQVKVMYQSHVQDIGWQQYFADGETSGVVGRGLKVEAMKIEARNGDEKIDIQYKTHVQDIGWENHWTKNGEQSGTTGRNLKIEAIQIMLDDKYEGIYSVEYRVYVEGQGWQEWKRDGEEAGSTGKNKKLEAIEIKIVDYVAPEGMTLRYTTHLQDLGWQNYSNEGQTSGTIGRGLKVEALKIKTYNFPEGVTINYRTHVQDIGWENTWKTSGEQSGTTGRNLKVEAIQIKLVGTEEYSIAYRAYVQGQGWQDWSYDGETAGSTGKNLRLEALEIKIVPKLENKTKMDIDTMIPTKLEQCQYKIKGWLMSNVENAKMQLLVNNQLANTQIERTDRQDVLDAIKGYGGQDKNPKPGFEITVDLNQYPTGAINFKIQAVDGEGNVLQQRVVDTTLYPQIKIEYGTYGSTGLKIAGRGGSSLPYTRWGNGENVFFATFAVHGFEDKWAKDGYELIEIADRFNDKLVSSKDYDLAQKWTIYIFPGVNQDGLTNGYTNNGPGRTTLYSQAPNHQGIDLNRCWQVGDTYERFTSARNYNGTAGFQAYEARALREFFLSHKSQNGQTILVDLHGWTQQLIGDEGICSYYGKQFPENNPDQIGHYGSGYMINWARTYLGSGRAAAKSALIELPKVGITSHQSVLNENFAGRYIDATLSMLKSII